MKNDPAKIDRVIRKEPAYHSKPQYFLLMFGKEAEKRIWGVLDGEDFYLDTNGNGDLTEPEKTFSDSGEVKIEGDGGCPITICINPPNRDGVRCCFAYVQGFYIQTTSIKPTGRPENLPVYHFQGSLRIDLFGAKELIRGQPNVLSVVIGTPSEIGDREGEWVTVWQSESIPPSVSPRMEIEFPSRESGSSPIKVRVALQRTGQAAFFGTVLVPDEAGSGNAKVHLSFPDWKGFDVAPTVRELPLAEAGPDDEAIVPRRPNNQPRLIDEAAPPLDLATIDRSVPAELKYKSKPKYCLLLLGREAKTRIWLILDGDTLYVDRNGLGSWIEADKRDAGRTLVFTVREIEELDGTRHTDLKVYAQASRIHPGRYRFDHISMMVNGQYGEYTCIGSADCDRSMDSPQEAPLRHFNGPLRVELLSQIPLSLGDQPTELEALISTRYPSGEWVFVNNCDGIPTDIHPTAEIEFPNRTPGRPPIKLKIPLSQRC